MSDPGPPERPRRGLLIGVAVGVVLALVVAVALLGDGSDGDPADTSGGADVEAADDGASTAEEAQDPDSTSAAEGPEGTRNFAEVPDEIPAGLVPDSATEIDGTVARGGANWSAAVVFRTPDGRRELEAAIDAATESAGFTRREVVEDSERRVIRYDGADGAVLSVTLRHEGDVQLVAAVIVSG